MQRLSHFILLCFAILLAGCSAASDSDRDWTTIPPMDTTAQARKTSFETRTDTILAQAGKQHAEPEPLYNAAPVRFTVQIGSFAESQNAAAVQLLARQRYQLPVVNDYSAARKRYQIRIGFFETQEDAAQFLAKLRSDFPQEYKDAWVVQIGK